MICLFIFQEEVYIYRKFIDIYIDYYKEILSICFSYYPNISTLHYILDTNLNFFLENETFFIKKIKLFKLTNVFFK